MSALRHQPSVFDVVVVGTGPAGVSACWPLVEAGWSVLAIDAGLGAVAGPNPVRASLFDIRMDRQERLAGALLGTDSFALRDVKGLSPKLRTAAGPSFTEGYREVNRIDVHNFQAVGALTLGGLSNVWGAGVSLYDDADLGGGPVQARDLAPSYARVAARIGISGEVLPGDGQDLPLQPPLPLSDGCQRLLRRANRRRRADPSVYIGKPLNAVITRQLDGRQACSLDNMCMWGCSKRSVYNAADELPRLRRHANFGLRPGFAVDTIRRSEHGYVLSGTDRRTGEATLVEARRVVLAAGAIPTTRLTLDLLGLYGRELSLQSSPAAGFAMLSPGRIGAPLSPQSFALAQLTIRCNLDGRRGDYAYGSIFEAEGVSAADVASQLPLTRIGAMGFMRHLVTALQIGLIYLPGEYGDTRVRLSLPDGDGRTTLAIRGGIREGTAATFRRISRLISIEFLRSGAFVLPGSMQVMTAGAEVHYGASLPMGGEFVSAAGEVRGAPGVFVADGAALPRVAAKHHTFTIMANADRIGLGMARAGAG